MMDQDHKDLRRRIAPNFTPKALLIYTQLWLNGKSSKAKALDPYIFKAPNFQGPCIYIKLVTFFPTIF